MWTTMISALVAGAALAGSPAAQAPEAGRYRGVLTSAGGELPFLIDLERTAETYRAFLVNGDERAEVDRVRVEGSSLTLAWPVYGNVLEADFESGELTGVLKLARRDGKTDELPFKGRLGESHRFFAKADPSAAGFAGRWEVAFARPDGTNGYPAVGEFVQTGARVTGTFRTETGDFRFLAGEARGRRLYLSTFYGGTPALYVAELGADGSLAGDRWSGKTGHLKWTAKRNASAALRDPQRLTFLKDGERLEFTFPNLDGKPVSLSDPRYRGKVVVVSISGSWCPNCHDETAFLAPFYRENRHRGLEAIALMYEYSDDFAQASAAARRFRDKFGVEYELLVAGVSDKDAAGRTLPLLNHVFAYPTTIVIDRKGVVRRIHTGFDGPATGEAYHKHVREFSELIESLLAGETE
jgi:peroxiredoxin